MSSSGGTNNGYALGGALSALLQAPIQVATALAGAVGKQQRLGGCEIPPPCWEPRLVATCTLELAPSSTGLIRIHVSNCGWTRQVASVTALGRLAGSLTMQPTALSIDPQDRARFVVTVHPPKGLKPGQSLSGVVLMRGCKDYAIRVEIKISDCPGTTTCDVSIDDCPDHVHHWYEHFYCPRPCRNPSFSVNTRG